MHNYDIMSSIMIRCIARNELVLVLCQLDLKEFKGKHLNISTQNPILVDGAMITSLLSLNPMLG